MVALATRTNSSVLLDAISEETVEDSGFPPLDFYDDDDDGNRLCSWDDDYCMESAEYYVLSYCQDPSCSNKHRHNYCRRRYLISLIRHLHSLEDCSHQTPNVSEEDHKLHVLRYHIADFGPLAVD